MKRSLPDDLSNPPGEVSLCCCLDVEMVDFVINDHDADADDEVLPHLRVESILFCSMCMRHILHTHWVLLFRVLLNVQKYLL